MLLYLVSDDYEGCEALVFRDKDSAIAHAQSHYADAVLEVEPMDKPNEFPKSARVVWRA